MEPEEVLEQEPVVEEPVSEPEPVVEPETPAEEPVTEPEPQPAPEPLQINTHGQWETLEHFMQQELEVGKTYRITVKGNCEFMISKDKPTIGIIADSITFTKQEDTYVWIKTKA